jgi:maleate cis-trans isomerase
VYTVPDDPLSRGDQFYDEARRLLEQEEQEESPASIATILGLMIIGVRSVFLLTRYFLKMNADMVVD